MVKTLLKSLWYKYRSRWQDSHSLLCIGLDPDLTQLPECVLNEKNPIWEFNRRIIDATGKYACAYKPNLAFYLRDGIRGLEALQLTVNYIPEYIPVILDCKVGDIGTTMEQYVSAFMELMDFDAITVNPLLGTDLLKPILEREDGFAFVLTLTSNPSANDFFIKENMAVKIAKWLNNFPPEKIGAVVGATQVTQLKEMRELMPGRIFLIPGIGAQGGDLDAVMHYTKDSDEFPNILINSSRGIIFQDRSPKFAQAAEIAAKNLQERIGIYT
jgi:orotidine-5'-phosphate decarboxylase